MDSIRGVFESLNCVICKKPYARVARFANDPQSPRDLCCGTAMCLGCWQMEISLGQDNKKHQCSILLKDHYGSGTFYLIDVLAQEEALILAPKKRGYLLAKPFKIPECPLCHDEYSNQIEEKKSAWLYCGHIICKQCYLKIQKPNGITCPVCNHNYGLLPNPEKNTFNDFLDELPEMMRQLKTRICDDCQEGSHIEQMIYCPKCSSKSCESCADKKHREHEAISLLATEVGEVTEELQNDCETSKGVFSELHKELLEDIGAFETKLTLLKGEILKDVFTAVVLEEKQGRLMRLRTDFEATLEEYLPQLREMNTIVKELMRALDKPDTQ